MDQAHIKSNSSRSRDGGARRSGTPRVRGGGGKGSRRAAAKKEGGAPALRRSGRAAAAAEKGGRACVGGASALGCQLLLGGDEM